MTIARDTTVGEAEPVAYGIATGNRFAMVDLGDEMEDPSEIYKLIEKENAAKKAEQKKKKEKKPAPKKEEVKPVSEKPAAEEKDNSRGRGRGRGGRGGRGRGDFGGNRGGDTGCRICHQEGHFARECPDKPAERDTGCRICHEEGHFARECPNKKEGDDRRPRYDRNRDDGDRPPRMQEGEEGKGEEVDGDKRRGGYRGSSGSRGRGGRGGTGYRGNRDTNRQFDRRSGDNKSSAVKGGEKREGGGAHNWGNATEEPDAAAEPGWGTDAPPAEAGDAPVEASGFDNIQASGFDNIEASGFDNVVAAADPAEGGEAAPAEEPEPDQMTFEEYQKQQKESKMKKEFNIRKAGENEDDTQWKNFAPLKKEDNTVAYMGGEDEYEKIIVRGGRKKNFVDVNVKFAARRGGGGGGRDDRGGDRRGGGRRGMERDVRDGDFGPRSGGSKGPKAANVDIENVNDFPSLS